MTEFETYKAEFASHYSDLELLHAENSTIKKSPEEPKEEEEVKPVDVENLKGKLGIPDFWYRSIKNNQMIYELVKEKDEVILENHLQNIETEKKEPDTTDPNSRKSLSVKFHFSENEYFPEKILFLNVIYKPNTEDEVEKIEGTPISWSDESKDPTKKKLKKKQKNKKTNETRTIVKTVEAESFFNVFTNRVPPNEGDLDEEEENELRDRIDISMNLAEELHEVLIPDALAYYLDLNDDIFDGCGGCEDEHCKDNRCGHGGKSDDDSDEEESDKKKTKKTKNAEKKTEGGTAASSGD